VDEHHAVMRAQLQHQDMQQLPPAGDAAAAAAASSNSKPRPPVGAANNRRGGGRHKKVHVVHQHGSKRGATSRRGQPVGSQASSNMQSLGPSASTQQLANLALFSESMAPIDGQDSDAGEVSDAIGQETEEQPGDEGYDSDDWA